MARGPWRFLIIAFVLSAIITATMIYMFIGLSYEGRAGVPGMIFTGLVGLITFLAAFGIVVEVAKKIWAPQVDFKDGMRIYHMRLSDQL